MFRQLCNLKKSQSRFPAKTRWSNSGAHFFLYLKDLGSIKCSGPFNRKTPAFNFSGRHWAVLGVLCRRLLKTASADMAALIRVLVGRRCPSPRCLRAGLFRERLGRAPWRLLRGTAALPSGPGRTLPTSGRARHTEASGPAEVDLKRLEGEDNGRKGARISSDLNTKAKRAVTSVSTSERLNCTGKSILL